MRRYHIRYHVKVGNVGSDHIGVISTEFPIEYDSDILATQQAVALELWHGSPVRLIAWRELKGETRPEADAGPTDPAPPKGWLYTLHMEAGQTVSRFAFTQDNPFGVAGRDYSAEYTVTVESLVVGALATAVHS